MACTWPINGFFGGGGTSADGEGWRGWGGDAYAGFKVSKKKQPSHHTCSFPTAHSLGFCGGRPSNPTEPHIPAGHSDLAQNQAIIAWFWFFDSNLC